MPSVDHEPGSPGSEAKEALAFYKSQIQALESELADFQSSSRELEQELEKELEASEKQHRDLRNKNEQLRYEVEEWKNKYKQAKTEANSAQNALQKEITTLRDQNRTISLRLRDIEVSNDDFERQERIVKSSLEDLEQKYNQGIERGVMMDEEIRIGEQEREGLRIECQRLREELADLKIEQDITVEKLNNATAMAAKYGHGSLHHVPPPSFQSPMSETGSSVLSRSPTTPTTASAASTSTPQSDHSPTPPSPPMSEISATTSNTNDPALTPRPKVFSRTRPSRGPSFGGGYGTAIPLPPSRSLHQIRGLIGQMQRLEQRVQHARSKLPGPSTTPPKASPRTINLQGSFIPSNITVRSHKKHRSPSMTSSVTSSSTDREPYNLGASRLSFGHSERSSSRTRMSTSSAIADPISRPSSRTSVTSATTTSRSSIGLERSSNIPQRPSSRAPHDRTSIPQRPSSRAPHDRTSIPQRPPSRASISGHVTTPLGTHAEFGMTGTMSKRDRASMDSYKRGALAEQRLYITPARRNTVGRELLASANSSPGTGSAIPTTPPPLPSGLPRKGFAQRRVSTTDGSDMPHGLLGSSLGLNGGLRRKKLSGVGETY